VPLVWANTRTSPTAPHLSGIRVITKTARRPSSRHTFSDRGGESQMTIYTPEEAAAVKQKSIMVAPQY
jgi:hypothetical protein